MRKALYAGSFDPLTCGHVDLIKRAAKLYDELVVGVISSPAKKPFFTEEERKQMIKGAIDYIPNVTVDSFSGLLAEYVNANSFNVVIRGLRGSTDFEYEIQMAQMNERLFNKGTESVFLMTSPRFSFISSSMIKEVVSLNGCVKGLVPEKILDEIVAKIYE